MPSTKGVSRWPDTYSKELLMCTTDLYMNELITPLYLIFYSIRSRINTGIQHFFFYFGIELL